MDQDTQIKIEQESIKQQLSQAVKINEDFGLKQDLVERLSNPDPNVQASVLNDPRFNKILIDDPKLADSVAGRLDKNLAVNRDALNALKGTIGYYKAQELKLKQNEVEGKAKKTAFDTIDKSYIDVLSEGKLAGITTGMRQNDIYNNLEAYPAGTKQVDPKTKRIIPDTADKPITPGMGYDVFKNGVKQEGVNLNDTEVSKLFKFKNSYSLAYGLPAPTAQGVASSDIPTSTPAAAQVKTLSDLTADSVTTGVPADEVQKIIEKGKEAGASATFLERTANDLAPSLLNPNFIDKSAVSDLYESGDTANVRKTINVVADQKAQSVLNVLQQGAPAEKEALRDWATANNISLTPSSLREYFVTGIRSTLSKNYNEAYNLGLAEQQKVKGSNAAVEQAKNTKLEALKGKTPEDAVRTVEKAAELSKELGLSAAQTKKEVKTVSDVEFHPLLKDQPAYVKAVAAVESGGNQDAVSKTGVKGLMQVTQKVAGMYGLNRNVPAENVLAGKFYIEDLFREFNGAKDLAYAAYNAGPSVVKYAQILAGGSDDWSVVKPFMYEALQKFQTQLPIKKGQTVDEALQQKFKEVYSYPEKVRLQERAFA